jgi:acetyl esterase
VYFHGGGWVIGDRDTHDVLCRQLCVASGCAVVSVDYRMGPEARFPAAVTTATRPCNGCAPR